MDKIAIELDTYFPPPRVLITIPTLQKIQAYTRAALPNEVNGLGIVERVGNDFLITDAFILKQKASPASAEIEPQAFAEFLLGLVERGEEKTNAKMKLQWHSHTNVGTFCSGTDLGTIADYQTDFVISLVVNARGEHHCRLDLYEPARVGFNVRLGLVLPAVSAELQERIRAEVAEKVQTAPVPFSTKLIRRIQRKKGGRGLKETAEEKEAIVPVEDLVSPKEGGREDG